MGRPPAVARGLRTRAAIAVPARAQQDAVRDPGQARRDASPPRPGRPGPRQPNTACLNADQLVQAVGQAFEEHADASIIRSFPGLGSLTGARVLAQIGDDRTRCANADSLKAYAASAPATRAVSS
nr:transposase [Streptomyces sp. SID1046]